MRRRPLLLAALLPVLLSACQSQLMKVDRAYVRLPAVYGRPAAVYFTLYFKGDLPDRLVSVTTPRAAHSEMHASGMNAGMATMSPLSGVDVPQNGTVVFSPAGNHVMLFDLAPDVTPGTAVPLTLHFKSGATLDTDARIFGAGDDIPD